MVQAMEMASVVEAVDADAPIEDVALAIALDEYPELDASRYLEILDVWADQCRVAVEAGRDLPAKILAINRLVYDELGFRGNAEDYYDPRNSCVGQVLDRRRGLPITLTLIYKLTLEPLGVVAVHGVNAPGHFLARVEAGGDFRSMLVDPFAGGRVLSVPEAVAQIRAAVGESVPLDADHLPLATHRAWIIRMLRNLVGVFGVRDASEERLAIEELMR
ncbi:MAG: transglutaminase family protein, partial [Myxococcales bacterium]|nr:transglutaminase family protein [Myxococcales bacterium]